MHIIMKTADSSDVKKQEFYNFILDFMRKYAILFYTQDPGSGSGRGLVNKKGKCGIKL